MAEVDPVSKLLHDLNNDLGLIMGHLDLALRGADSVPEGLRRRLENALKATHRMADTIKAVQSKRPK